MGVSTDDRSLVMDSDTTSPSTTRSSKSVLLILDEIRELAAHSKLLAKIHALNLAVETPLETVLRIGYQPWQNAAVGVALELGVFTILVEKEPKAVSAKELASKSGGDVILLGMSSLACSLIG